MGLLRARKPLDEDGAEVDAKASAKPDKATNTSPGTASVAAPVRGKGAPTPKRKDAEQARMQRLHPVLTKKEARSRDRELRLKRRNQVVQATETRPERMLLRNNVDAHWSVCEFTWPAIIILLAVSLGARYIPSATYAGSIAIWVFFGICALDIWHRWRDFKKEATERIPGFNSKGLLTYMASRMITMRRFRRPGAVIARGETY
ncbi:DUF3043 domain-containing protein [Propionibacterium sp.]|uniref:DUF3043 domain-containing protein n=1 Tax=Propionibacterium sp. TaxID=1977903 RepID=UPI0039EC12C4